MSLQDAQFLSGVYLRAYLPELEKEKTKKISSIQDALRLLGWAYRVSRPNANVIWGLLNVQGKEVVVWKGSVKGIYYAAYLEDMEKDSTPLLETLVKVFDSAGIEAEIRPKNEYDREHIQIPNMVIPELEKRKDRMGNPSPNRIRESSMNLENIIKEAVTEILGEYGNGEEEITELEFQKKLEEVANASYKVLKFKGDEKLPEEIRAAIVNLENVLVDWGIHFG